MYNLALCYDFGTLKNISPMELFPLPNHYFFKKGEGLTQDIPKAVELYNRSANGGYAVGACAFSLSISLSLSLYLSLPSLRLLLNTSHGTQTTHTHTHHTHTISALI